MFEVDELGLDEFVLEPHATATTASSATARYFTATKPTDVENLGVERCLAPLCWNVGYPGPGLPHLCTVMAIEASAHGLPGAEADQGGKPDGQYGGHDQRC
jgi:hypothetical protein